MVQNSEQKMVVEALCGEVGIRKNEETLPALDSIQSEMSSLAQMQVEMQRKLDAMVDSMEEEVEEDKEEQEEQMEKMEKMEKVKKMKTMKVIK